MIEAERTQTIDLRGGASLVVPAGAIRDGSRVTVDYEDAPVTRTGTMRLLGPATGLRVEPSDAIVGPLSLRFAVADAPTAGIATYDQAKDAWVPVPATFDAATKAVTAQISHFSWWNPFTWDWAGIGASVNQGVGQVLGKRAGQARCTSGQSVPAWVSSTPGISNEPAIAVRSCTQGNDGVLDVQLVNNRPHGMTLTYGSAVKWGWHQPGDSPLDRARDDLYDRIAKSNTLYLPPKSAASLGIKPMDGGNAPFKISVTRESFLADVAAMVAPELIGAISRAACVTFLAKGAIQDGSSPHGMLSLVRDATSCIAEGLVDMAAAGQLDRALVSQVEAKTNALKKASLVGWLITAYDVEWRLLDLWIDAKIAPGPSDLGAGFSVFARSSTPPVTGGSNPGPTKPAPSPKPPSVPKDWQPRGGGSTGIGCPSLSTFFRDLSQTVWEATSARFVSNPVCVRPNPPYPRVGIWWPSSAWAAAVVDVNVSLDIRTNKKNQVVRYTIIMYNAGTGEGWVGAMGSSWAVWRTSDGSPGGETCSIPPDRIRAHVRC